MYANKKYHFYQNPKIYTFSPKITKCSILPAARIEMSTMNSHLVENVLANTIKYK